MAIRIRERRRRIQVVRFQLVVEGAPNGHALRDLGQLLFSVSRYLDLGQHLVIPMIPATELPVTERVRRVGDVDRAESCGVDGANRWSILAIPNLVVAASAHEIVRERVEREEHADPTFRVGVEDHDMPVVFRAHVDSHPIANFQIAVAVQPHLHGLILGAGATGCRHRQRLYRHQQGKKGYRSHGTSDFGQDGRAEPVWQQNLFLSSVASCMPQRKLL